MFAAVRFYSTTGNGLNAALRCRGLLPLRFAACLVRWKVRDHFAFLFGGGTHDFSGWFVLPIFQSMDSVGEHATSSPLLP
jgi:hypothetical protein